MRPQRKRRLFGRVVAMVSGLIVLAVALPSARTIGSQHELLLRKLRDGAVAMGKIAALAASDPLAAGDPDMLTRLVATVAHENHDVEHAFVTDRIGRVVAHSQPEREGTYVPDLAEVPRELLARDVTGADGVRRIQVSAPILVSGEPWGTLRIVLPVAPVEEETWLEGRKVAATGLLVLALGVLGAWQLAASIARPVEGLAALAAEVARGNFEVRSDLRTADEVGDLARTFDLMTEELARASAKLRGYSASLAREVAERTEELRAAKDAAEEAGRAKSEFLAAMSHEIRTPLNGIFGMTELALDTSDDIERRYFLGRARACAESLLTIINDVLDFSKIEAGKLELEDVPFDVHGVLEGVLDTLAVEASRRGLELIGFVDPSLPTLRGDPARLRQVALNLANNALKFTEIGEVVIRFESATDGIVIDEAGGIELRCTVQDTGIGIPFDKQEAIFESFTQADASDARRFGGTGLGLAIAQRLVRLMGGEISVRSEVGRGSVFTFTAWLRQGDAPGRRVLADLSGRRILVVDDNATNRTILLKTLEAWGCRVTLAAGGREACDLLGHAVRTGEPFDAVILDMQMPDLDGLATADRVRRDPGTRAVPIVLLTSIGSILPETVRRVPFMTVLLKPAKQAELHQAIAAAVADPAASETVNGGLARRHA